MTDDPALARAELLNDVGRYDEAVAALGPVLAAAPGDVDALIQLGRAHAGRGDVDGMLRTANILVGIRPENFYGHLLASSALYRAKDYRGALTAAAEAVRRAPDLAVCHSSVAWAASELPGQEGLAAAAADRAVVLDPGSSGTHFCAGTVAMERGDKEAAARAYAEALRLDPGNADARHNLAVLRSRQWRLFEAAQGLLSSAAMDPRHHLVARNLAVVVRQGLGYLALVAWVAHFSLAVAVDGGDGPVAGLVVPAVVVQLVTISVLAWLLRWMLLRLHSQQRAALWRVLRRSVLSMVVLALFGVAFAAQAAVVVGPTSELRGTAELVGGFSLIIGTATLWVARVIG